MYCNVKRCRKVEAGLLYRVGYRKTSYSVHIVTQVSESADRLRSLSSAIEKTLNEKNSFGSLSLYDTQRVDMSFVRFFMSLSGNATTLELIIDSDCHFRMVRSRRI